MKPAVAFRKAAQLIEADRCVGCCCALIIATGDAHEGLSLARDTMAGLLGYVAPEPEVYNYWWPISLTNDTATPRLIALELAALLSEESPARLSKSSKP